MPKISFMVHTASYDGFLKNQGINSYFDAVTRNLTFQTFKDFEFIYIDTFYEENQEAFKSIIDKLPFKVKHVPIHKNHRYWFDQGYVYISAAKNTGILYADGELLISCDDAEFFPDNFLSYYWDAYSNGRYLHAVHKRMKSILVENGHPIRPLSGEIYINDHRLITTTDKIKHHRNGDWLFAGTSFSLGDALHLNGFNERMDSCKSLEDCDFGNRLKLIGRSFVINTDAFCYILDHSSYCDVQVTSGIESQISSLPEAPKKKEINNLVAIENYGMYKCSQELIEPQANKFPITDAHLKIIQRETLKYRGFDPLGIENKEKLDIWLKTPTFDLKKEWQDLRHSEEWKW